MGELPRMQIDTIWGGGAWYETASTVGELLAVAQT